MIPTAAFPGDGPDSVLSGNEGNRSIHAVQFYEEEEALIDRLADFFGAALGAGQPCIMIATPAHRLALLSKLQKRGLNVEQIVAEGRFRLLDSADTLASFSVRGVPRPALFFEVMGELLNAMMRKGQGRERLALFGEIVALLWEEGRIDEATQLEGMWNALGKQYRFSLLCAYPMQSFEKEADRAGFQRLCAEHTHALPCESYSRLSDETARLRMVCELQQRAGMADAALERQRVIESDLKEVQEMAETLLEDSQGTVTVSELRGMVESLCDSVSLAKSADGITREAYCHLESAEEELAKLGRLMKQKLDFANPRWRN